MSFNSPRRCAAAIVCGLALAIPARAGTLSFAFDTLAASDAHGLLDVGTISARHERGALRDAQVRERVAVRLEGGMEAPPTARVSVALLHSAPGAQIRVDGVLIGPFPRVVDATHRVGAWVVHEIEVSVPSALPAGPLIEELQWFAETE